MNKDSGQDKTARPARLVVPAATVLICSGCIMVLELVAARLIARDLGSSLYTWTSVIGVVLAGISLGNYVGGRIADRYPSAQVLGPLFAACSLSCVLIVVLNNLAGQWVWLWKLSWPVRVFGHVLLVFMLPSTLLGTISPVVAKWALDRGLPTGRTVGTIYAWGAVGSIAGTFIAGYWLIAAIGTVKIVWAVAGLLLVMAILYGTRFWLFCGAAMMFVSALAAATLPAKWCRAAGVALALREAPDPTIIYSDDTPYCYVYVRQLSKDPDKREFMQDKLTHSRIVMDDINDLQYFYTKIYAAVTRGLSTGKKTLSVLAIGGGGYVFPRYVEKNWPGSSIEVVEIDPGVTRAAMAAFGLDPDTSIKTVNVDARNYVDRLVRQQNRTGRRRCYDFIYGDAVNDYSAPFQLLTKEFNDSIARILCDHGAYMLTLIDIYEQGQYLGAAVNTLKRSFAHVYVMTDAQLPDGARNTFVVVAAKQPIDIGQIVARYPQKLTLRVLNEAGMDYLEKRSKGIILTDDYAPVENLLAPVVRASARRYLGIKYFRDAQRAAAAGQFRRGIELYNKAAGAEPQLTIEALTLAARLAYGHAEYGEAVEALERIIEYDHENNLGLNLAAVHELLGLALEKLGRKEQAARHLRKAEELGPTR